MEEQNRLTAVPVAQQDISSWRVPVRLCHFESSAMQVRIGRVMCTGAQHWGLVVTCMAWWKGHTQSHEAARAEMMRNKDNMGISMMLNERHAWPF